MSEGFFSAMCKERNLPYTCESAGLATITGLPAAENSVRAMSEYGVDISHYTSTSVDDLNLDDYYLFAVMTQDHKDELVYCGVPAEKIYILARDTGGIGDPYGGSPAIYAVCAKEIKQAVEDLILYLGEHNGD